MDAQGWFVDPFGLHTERWFSAGAPTRLVRDGATESYDPSPDTAVTEPLTRLIEDERPDGADLARADEPYTVPNYKAAAIEAFVQASHTS